MKKKRVSKDEWFAGALTALETGGVEAIRVERLAWTLYVSKSGFYWHFKDRKDFLNHLLNLWEVEYTKLVMSDPNTKKGSPKQRLLRVVQMV